MVEIGCVSSPRFGATLPLLINSLMLLRQGAGNTVFPLLAKNENPHLVVHACDYAASAVEVVKVRAVKSVNVPLPNYLLRLSLPFCVLVQSDVPRSTAWQRYSAFLSMGCDAAAGGQSVNCWRAIKCRRQFSRNQRGIRNRSQAE